MFSEELAPVQNTASPLATLLAQTTNIQKYSDEEWAVIAKAAFFPRLQLLTDKSKKVTKREFPVNHYASISGQDYTDLGESVDCVAFAWRPKALDVSDQSTPISVFDIKDPEFQRIYQQTSVPNSGCMCGAEFLVWLPQLKEFVTFYMGSKSGCVESPNVKKRIGQSMTLKSKYIETKKFNWYTATATVCTSTFELPPVEQLQEALDKFNNPPIKVVETVTEGEERG